MLIPLLDILQSVPVLGFLSVTVTAFIALFPASSSAWSARRSSRSSPRMAWNMTFAFYHSLITQPRDLDEAARIMRLTRWQRFWRLDVPSGDDPAGVERDDELRRRLVLPGRLGGHHRPEPPLRAARHRVLRRRRDRPGATWARSATPSSPMVVLVLGVNFLFWRPLTAWAERFRVEESESAREAPQPGARRAAPLRHSRAARPAAARRSAACSTGPPGRSAWPSIRSRAAAGARAHRGRVLRRR